MENNIAIEQNIKKRIRTFIKPNGEKIEGGAEAYFNGKTGKDNKPDIANFKFK